MLKTKWVDLSRYIYTVKKLDRGELDARGEGQNERQFRYIFAKLSSYFESKELNRETIYEYFEYLERKCRLAPPTLNNHLKVVKHLCRYLELNYVAELNFYKEVEPYIEVLTKEELEKLINAAYKISPCAGLMIETLCKTGLRNSEIRSLTWNDFKTDRFILRTTKSGKIQQVILLPDLSNKLSTWQRMRKFTYIFATQERKMDKQTINGYIKRACQIAGITKTATCHTLRHSVGHIASTETENIFRVQKFMRHASPNTTLRYSHLNLEDTRMVAESLSPVSVTFDSLLQRFRWFRATLQGIKFPITYEERGDEVLIRVKKCL